MQKHILLIGVLISLSIGGAIGYLTGVKMGEYSAQSKIYQKRFSKIQRDFITQVLADEIQQMQIGEDGRIAGVTNE